VVALLLVGVLAFGVVLNMRRQAAPQLFDAGVAAMITNLETRAGYWRLALETLARQPILGIGVSQFHEGPPDASGQRSYTAHAHNIFLQVALDVGFVGLAGYLWTFGWCALRARHTSLTFAGLITSGAALSLVATHLFGLTDAIALGSKVGLFQWLCAGIVIAEWSVRRSPRLRQS
jgi:putative inorganic carbon (HCO3(-)) transporter